MTDVSFTRLEREFSELSSAGIIPGLERLAILLPLLGDPQDAFPAVHVVGTNGKGSTCATLASILTASGLRAAVYTSPHLVTFGERLVIGGEPVAAERWVTATGKIKNALSSCEGLQGNRPTYFELITAAAFLIIAEEGVDIAIVEAGLGGRLDATSTLRNVVLTLITPIGIDHTEYLGTELLSIAREKFAVIRGDAPAIFSGGEFALEDEFCKTARERGTPAFLLRQICSVDNVITSLTGTDFTLGLCDGMEMHTPLAGLFQAENAALAICAAHLLSGRFSPAAGRIQFPQITGDTIAAGVKNTSWPGRLEAVALSPLVVLDGAHNPHAMNRLVETLSAITDRGQINIVLALMRDKDATEVIRLLKPLEPTIYCTRVPDMERSLTAEELHTLCVCNGLTTTGGYDSPMEALKASRRIGKTTVCCGSLYLVGYLKGHIDELDGI